MIGEKLEQLLKMRKMKPGTLASKTGIPKSTIYSIIRRNNKSVEFSKIEKIASFLDVPVEYFYDTLTDSEEYDEQKEKPAPISEDGLDSEIIGRLRQLTAAELQRVDDFVQGLLASR